MARKVLQILVLPFLFSLLGAGGKTTFCGVISSIGLEAHHHAEHGGEEREHAGPFCFESHDEEEHGHDHETLPCPESCEIRLSEAPAPSLAKLPMLEATALPPSLLEVPAIAELSLSDFVTADIPDPPEDGPPLLAPSVTGRFLI